MLHHFFTELRAAKIPVTTREYLTLLEALDKGVIEPEIKHFYSVSRAALVKDEKDFDKFDMVFGHVFKGVEMLSQMFEDKEIPDEWLQAMMKRMLTEEEMAELKALPFDELMETLKKRLEEQEKRHEGSQRSEAGLKRAELESPSRTLSAGAGLDLHSAPAVAFQSENHKGKDHQDQ